MNNAKRGDSGSLILELKMKPFEYYEPESLEEACLLLAGFKEESKVLAGGTDLLVQLKEGLIDSNHVINLKTIPGLNKLVFDERRGLRIGALVTWTMLLDAEPVKSYYPALRQAAETMACMQVRNRATLAGNICHASPAANGPIPLLLYGAECKILGPTGERAIPIGDMFIGVQKNALRHDEILTEITIPSPPGETCSIYYKLSTRKAMDLAVVGIGLLVGQKRGIYDLVRIALGAVATTPIRAVKAEDYLKGKPADNEVMKEAAEIAARECSPVSDVRASKEYRIELVKGLVCQALKECAESRRCTPIRRA